MEDLKVRFAVLWLFIAGAMSANTLLYFVVPGVIDEIRSGVMVGMQSSAELILGMAIAYYWVPLTMAILSLTLSDKATRLANIVLGAFYVIFVLFELAMNVTTVAYPYAVLMDVSVIGVAAFAVWNAWKWKTSAYGV